MITAVLVTAALAQGVVVNPAWVTTPSGEMLEEAMPPFATLISVDAHVTLECRTLIRVAAPQDCEVVSTTVRGMGFEAKALETAMTGLIAPRAVNGFPKPGHIRFTVHFRAEDWKAVAPRPYVGPEPSAERLRLARTFVDLYHPPRPDDLYAELYPELEPIRRARVQRWVRELFPLDEERERTRAALFLARLLSEADLKTAVATGVIPRERPGNAEFEKAASDFGDPRYEAQAAELRARYCAAYDCGEQPG
ncbi:hypothetical protein BH10PSE1_BH10PSE1_18610 [soil metagenome]